MIVDDLLPSRPGIDRIDVHTTIVRDISFLFTKPMRSPNGPTLVAEYQLFPPRCFGLRCVEIKRLAYQGKSPVLFQRSHISGWGCISFASGSSSATLLLLMQFSVCCIDRLICSR